MSHIRCLPAAVLLAAVSLPLLGQEAHRHGAPPPLPPADGGKPGVSVLNVPDPDLGIDTLAAREQAQRATVGRFKVFHGFRFTDRLPESGITFVHHTVEDAGKTYKAAHYDHGNGVAAADVDGDGRIDVYLTSQLGTNELWKNLGDGRFENVTAAAGVAMAGRISVSASFADVDNDGDQDLYVTTVRMGNALFENDGKGRFKDVSKGSGLDYVGHSSGAVFFDYDRDGRLDLFLANVGKYTTETKGTGGYYIAYEDAFSGHMYPERTEISRLYRNLGGTGGIHFADVTEQTGLKDGGWSGDASVADFNEDGWPDLYVLNMQGDNHYWENHEGKTFVETVAKYLPKTPWGAMGIKVFDADGDGRMDLLITDMHSDMLRDFKVEEEKLRFEPQVDMPNLQGGQNNVFGNAFYKNLGDGDFVEISGRMGLENYWPWGVSVDDLNADGWDDVLITASMNYPFRYGVNSLLLNNRGEIFLDSEFLLGIEPRRDGSGIRTRKPWFTLDCSGADKADRRCEGRSGSYTFNSTLGTRSAAIFDFDGDGDLDILTNEFGAEPMVLVSDLAQRKKIHWLGVRLQGSASNRDGLGARVTVHAGRRSRVKVLDGSSGYLSHSVLPLYFGLDEAEAVDSVEVRWPSGATQTVPGPLAANRILDITEPAPATAHNHAMPAMPGDAPIVNVPEVDIGADTLAARERDQRATVDRFKVFHGFRFTDRLPESGITFVHQIVDDAGSTYKAAHYDHGNGVAVADVDGDGLTDVYFTSQMGGNELWKNLGDGRFKNITAEAGVGLKDRVSVSAAFADIDNDGDEDLYVTTVRMGNALFENDGKGRFKDVSKASGLDYAGHSSGAVFFDYDRDGRLDLFLVNVGKYTTEERGRGGYYIAYENAFSGHLFPERTERSVLYRNEGGTGGIHFADVSAQVGLQDGSWSGDASAADFNADGWPDLYVLNMQGDDHFYENREGKAFVDVTDKYFPKTPWGAMGIKVFDADNDGLMDLLITDMHSDMLKEAPPRDEKLKFTPQVEIKALQGQDNNIFGNAFYHNLGGGRFAEESDSRNLENYWPWGVSVDDLNADGWDDVLITSSMNFPFRYGVNSLRLNNRGEGFLDSEFLLGIEPRRGGRTRKNWFALDCSGAHKATLPCQGRTGRFTATGTLGSRSAAIFDFDGDGDLDIVTNDLNSEPQVFVSDLAQQRKIHWLKVRLRGTASNRDGLGAVVKVHVGPRVLTKVLDGSSGYLSHSVLPLYFGLDEATKVDSIEVRWPSGSKQTVPGPIAADRTLDVSEVK